MFAASTVPALVLLGLLLACVVGSVYVRRLVERTGGRSATCRSCGYSLEGLREDQRCPECGTIEPSRIPEERVRVHISAVGIGAFVVLQSALMAGGPPLLRMRRSGGGRRRAWPERGSDVLLGIVLIAGSWLVLMFLKERASRSPVSTCIGILAGAAVALCAVMPWATSQSEDNWWAMALGVACPIGGMACGGALAAAAADRAARMRG